MEDIELKRIKVILLISSIVCLVLLILSAYRESFNSTWRKHQREYRAASIKLASDPRARASAEKMQIKFNQIFLPQLKRIDRCTTCHIGIDDPRMAEAPLPIRAHSQDIFKHHPIDKFGCTVCHDGQGRAVEQDAAHGHVPHWDKPLLCGQRTYTNCSRCHYQADLFGADEDLYASGGDPKPLDQNELSATVLGIENIRSNSVARGKQLVLRSGCLGCHKYRRRGGTLGPDITYMGDKTVHDFYFKHIKGEHTVTQWLFEHFKHPAQVTPKSLMPDMNLTDQQAHDLTQYMLSLHRKTMPAEYTPVPSRRSGLHASGQQLYSMFCTACHGIDGQGSTVREFGLAQAFDAPLELMVPSLNHPDTLAVASDDYLRSIITNGRSGTTMIAWDRYKGGGLLPQEIQRVVEHIRSWEPHRPDESAISASRGNTHIGRLIYNLNCSSCHGQNGEGGIGVRLNSPSVLGIASDQFLAKTIIEGRPNTAMPKWRQLDSQQISDLIAFLRSWHPIHNNRDTVLQLTQKIRSGESVSGVSSKIGQTLYKANCLMCHGPSGKGDLGPSLATQEFLTVVGNDYLYETLGKGRPGTGMPAWHHLSNQDVASLIVFMRTWQTSESRTLEQKPSTGDWDAGQFLYASMCASCHGDHAQGGVGPQLNNPIFLRTATDAMLREWINQGKTGTPMRGFLKDGQGMAELSAGQINDIVSFLRSLEHRPRVSVAKNPSGRPELGKLWYAVSCAQCHGDFGEGISGTALANPAFLEAASDGFL
ncbi:MAG: c-type cytochrome, partial [Planctomycetota bacterium]